jgi:ketosteroid isomerase-like protein
MKPDEPMQVVQSIYAAFHSRDIPKVFSLLSPDVHLVQSEELSWGGSYHGHVEARKFFAALTSHITTTVIVEKLIDSADHVVVIGSTQGTVNATGKSFKVPVAHIWRVDDGLAVHAQFFIDNPTMLNALARSSTHLS